MAFTPKAWEDFPDTTTPITAAALEDVETRLSDYTDDEVATAQPLDSDLTAIAALSTTSFGRALLALADAAAGRSALELGTASTHAHGDYETAGAAAAAQAASQPLDADLTAIAALSTTAFGRAFLALADAAAARTALALGTAATHAHGDYDVAGAAASAQAASQPLDSDLTSLAALTTTSYGRALLELANAGAARTALGLGTIATQDANNVTISGGAVTGITDVTVADGGTGASTAAGARSNLGVLVSTDVGGPHRIIRKTADETVNNVAAVQDDDHLVMSIAANEVWWIEAWLISEGASATADWLWGWSGPASCTAQWGILGTLSAFAGGFAALGTGGTSTGALRTIGQTIATGGMNGAISHMLGGWFVNSSTAGNITLRWSQNTATVENNTIKANSFLRCLRLA